MKSLMGKNADDEEISLCNDDITLLQVIENGNLSCSDEESNYLLDEDWELDSFKIKNKRSRQLSFDIFNFGSDLCVEDSIFDTATNTWEAISTPREKQLISNPHSPNKMMKNRIINTLTASANQEIEDTFKLEHLRDIFYAKPKNSNNLNDRTALQSQDYNLHNVDKKIGIYTSEKRKERLKRFHEKRKQRIWKKCIKYDCRKTLAAARPRIKGRFVKQDQSDVVRNE